MPAKVGSFRNATWTKDSPKPEPVAEQPPVPPPMTPVWERPPEPPEDDDEARSTDGSVLR